MCHENPCGQRAQQVVKIPITATGLVADLEAIWEIAEDSHRVLDASHLAAMDNLPCLVEGASRNVGSVNVETDVKHKAPLKVEERHNLHRYFHVIRLTEASFIVSLRRALADLNHSFSRRGSAKLVT